VRIRRVAGGTEGVEAGTGSTGACPPGVQLLNLRRPNDLDWIDGLPDNRERLLDGWMMMAFDHQQTHQAGGEVHRVTCHNAFTVRARCGIHKTLEAATPPVADFGSLWHIPRS
jgi:hypothetical protein